MNQNNLQTYDDEIIEKDEKRIYIIAIIVFFVLLVGSIITSIFVKDSYPLIISFVVGSIVSVALFYFTSKRIHQTHYSEYKKATKKIHMFYQITYLLAFIVLFLFFRTYFTIIGLVVGLLLIKISILFSLIKKRQKISNL